MQICHFPGMRDDPVCKTIRRHFRNSETDTVQCNRPFKDGVLLEGSRQLDLDPMIVPNRFDRQQFPSGINMTLDYVPIEPARCGQRSLKIDQIPDF
jgi:hypothetical protein